MREEEREREEEEKIPFQAARAVDEEFRTNTERRDSVRMEIVKTRDLSVTTSRKMLEGAEIQQ